MIKKILSLSLTLLCFIIAKPLVAAEPTIVPIHRIDSHGVGEKRGTISLEQTSKGVKLKANLKGFKAGKHAFHIHQNPDCKPGLRQGKRVAGLKAGGHYRRKADASSSHSHHHHHKPHGDLPELVANEEGVINGTQIITKITLKEIKHRSMIIHQHGENEKGKVKGGGERVACGIIPK